MTRKKKLTERGLALSPGKIATFPLENEFRIHPSPWGTEGTLPDFRCEIASTYRSSKHPVKGLPSGQESGWFEINHGCPIEGIQAVHNQDIVLNPLQLNFGHANGIRAPWASEREDTSLGPALVPSGMLQ